MCLSGWKNVVDASIAMAERSLPSYGTPASRLKLETPMEIPAHGGKGINHKP